MKKKLLTIFNKKKWAGLLSKAWLLKAVSLVLAVILWSFVGGEDRVAKNVMIPVEIINLPRDLVISNQYKKEIEVTVSGPRSLILEMSSRALTRQVDLSSAAPGTMVIENDNAHIPVLRGITVQGVKPSSIILSLDKLVQKQFPVVAQTVGSVVDGYYVKSLNVDPDVITITGPQTTLSQVDELYTKKINLEDVNRSLQFQVPLELGPAIVELIGETSVTAEITVGIEMVIKSMDRVKVHAVVDGVDREVKPKEVRVIANIPKLLLDRKIDPKSLFSLTASEPLDYENLKVIAVPRVDLELPIEILSIIPDTVMLVGSAEEPEAMPQSKSISNGNTPNISPASSITPASSDNRQALVVRGDEAGPETSGIKSIKLLKNTQFKKRL